MFMIKDSKICRPDGNKVHNPLSSPQYSRAYIKHYATKSLEEYLIKLFIPFEVYINDIQIIIIKKLI